MINPKHLAAAACLCGQPGSDGWAERVCDRLRKIDAAYQRIQAINAKRENFRDEMITLDKHLRLAQDGCGHEVKIHHERGTAEDQPWDECEICGKHL